MNKRETLVNSRWLSALSRWSLIAALAAAFWLFIPPYQWAFIGDDYIQLNRISGFLEQPLESWQIILPNWQTWYYRPLQNFVFLSNWLTFGLNPFGHYIGLILWHLLGMALLYQLGRRLGLAQGMATAVALLFGFHGHHYDVVTWLSAVAIVAAAVVSLAGLVLFARYLARPEKGWLLAAIVVVFVAGLLTHEEAFLLPIKMAFLWLLYPRAEQEAANGRDWLAARWREIKAKPALPTAFGLMGLLMTGYLCIQWTRPNLNINLQEGTRLGIAQIVDPVAISLYLSQVTVRTAAVFTSFPTSGNHLIAAGLLLVMGLWLWRADWLGRFGLLWWGLHIAFIYGALWIQRPDFFGGRHLYNGNMGLALAVGAAVAQLAQTKWGKQIIAPPRSLSLSKGNKPGLSKPGFNKLSQRGNWGRIVLSLLLAAVLLSQAVTLKQRQQSWLAIAEKDAQAQATLKEMLPELTNRTRVFAHRFAVDVTYMEGVLKVWYDRPELRGFSGRLTDLRQWGWLPGDIYLLDYANGRLINLMPELQSANAHLLLWAGGPQPLTVAGPPDDQRLAVTARLPDQPSEWQPLTYRLAVSDAATFHVAAGYGFAGETAATNLYYRIRLSTNGQTHILHEGPALPDQWLSHAFPLDAYAPAEITVHLEHYYSGERPSAFYWANPHLSR
jgi:hypothetical protein